MFPLEAPGYWAKITKSIAKYFPMSLPRRVSRPLQLSMYWHHILFPTRAKWHNPVNEDTVYDRCRMERHQAGIELRFSSMTGSFQSSGRCYTCFQEGKDIGSLMQKWALRAAIVTYQIVCAYWWKIIVGILGATNCFLIGFEASFSEGNSCLFLCSIKRAQGWGFKMAQGILLLFCS